MVKSLKIKLRKKMGKILREEKIIQYGFIVIEIALKEILVNYKKKQIRSQPEKVISKQDQ